MSREDPLRELTLVWAAMVGGVLVYTGVLYGLTATGVLAASALSPDVLTLAAGGVLLYMVGAVFFRRRLVAGIRRLPTREERLARYRTATMISLTFMELGGLVLVTIAILAGAATWILAGGGAAAVIMFLARPTADDL